MQYPEIKESLLPVVEAVLADPEVRQARTFSPDGKMVTRATRLFKASRRELRAEIRLTVGRPNADEVEEVRKLRKAGASAEDLGTVRTRAWPKGTKAGGSALASKREATPKPKKKAGVRGKR